MPVADPGTLEDERGEPVGTASAPPGRLRREATYEDAIQTPSPLLQAVEDYVGVEIRPPKSRDLPAFDAVVIYLGNDPRKNVALKGYVHRETWTDPRTGEQIIRDKVVRNERTEAYDFASNDEIGQPIWGRLVRSDFPNPKFAGRPVRQCKHPDHLRYFVTARENGQPAFYVKIKPAQQAQFEAWVLQNWQAEQKQDAFSEFTQNPQGATRYTMTAAEVPVMASVAGPQVPAAGTDKFAATF